MNPPRISVVMSVWNSRATVQRAVECILGQTWGSFEFVIVDDGSEDGSGALIAEFAARDNRIRVLAQANTGLTLALVAGCNAARGDWIVRQDADDWSEPDRIEKSLALAEGLPECNIISSWARYRGPDGELLEEVRRPADPEEATNSLLHRQMGPPAHGGVMFRRDAYELAGGYRPVFYFGQDSDLWLRMARIGKIAYVQKWLYNYTLSPSAISGRFGDVQRRFGELGQLCHAARLRSESESPYLDELAKLTATVRQKSSGGSAAARAGSNYRIGVQLARRGDPAAARYFRDAIRLQPLHWRAFVRWALCALRK